MKIISIDMGRDSNHAMVFINGCAIQSTQIANDYTPNDLAVEVYNNYKNSIYEKTIICDKNGIGIAFWDSFNALEKKHGEIDNLTKIDTILSVPENQIKIAQFISDKTYIKKIYKVFRNCGGLFTEFECDKLVDDIGKLSYETKDFGRIVINTNNCTNKSRVYCLLNVVALDLCDGLKCV